MSKTPIFAPKMAFSHGSPESRDLLPPHGLYVVDGGGEVVDDGLDVAGDVLMVSDGVHGVYVPWAMLMFLMIRQGGSEGCVWGNFNLG